MICISKIFNPRENQKYLEKYGGSYLPPLQYGGGLHRGLDQLRLVVVDAALALERALVVRLEPADGLRCFPRLDAERLQDVFREFQEAEEGFALDQLGSISRYA